MPAIATESAWASAKATATQIATPPRITGRVTILTFVASTSLHLGKSGRGRSLRRVSKRWRIVLLSASLVLLVLLVVSRKYISLYISRKPDPRPAVADLLRDPAASKDPETLLTEANRLSWLFNWPKAEPLFVRAEQLFKARNDTRNEIYARVGRIRAQSETMSWVDVSQMLGQQLNIPVVKNDPQLRLWCLAAIGYNDLEINPASAKLAWTEAKQIAHTRGENQWEARAEGELGIIGFLQGDSRRAAVMVGHALLSAKASGDVGGQVRMLEMLGNGFNEAKRYGEALAFFERAIKTSSATPDAGFPFMAYEGESFALVAQDKVSEAKEKLERALAAGRENKKLGHESMILQLLGELAMRTGDRLAATKYLEQSVELAQKYNFYRTLGQSMIDLAGLYRDAGDLKAAEMSASAGVDASRRVGDRYYLPRDLTVLADLKAQRGATPEAEALYENAEDVIDGMLVNLHEAYWSSSLAGAMSDTYLQHFELEARQGNVERALSVLERVRGRTAAAFLENKVSFNKDESEDVRALEDAVSDLQLRLMRSESQKERTSLLDQLVEYERRLELTRSDRTESKPGWLETPAPLKAIQETLRPDETVLEYVLSDPHSYCVWISKKKVGLTVLAAGRQQIEELTRRYLEQTRARHDDIALANQLYATLLSPLPVEATSERLIVVADGILHLLPFDALHDSAGAFLVETHTISYAPASTVLTVLRKTKEAREPRHIFLGLGDVPYRNQGHVSSKIDKPSAVSQKLLRGFSDALGTPLYDLPQTRAEVLELRKILGDDAVLLLGSDATETVFKSEPLDEFKIIHLAAHGFADTQFPERSGLVLGVDPNSRDDGLLQVREIIRLRFSADLVTLSACNTGVGKLQGEEGVTNLVEAFLVSGAKAVVASLWSADDTYTLALMERLYTRLKEGQDKAAALRQAKLDLLAKYGRQVPPYYWGAFVLVGDGGSPIRLGGR
ncbi:MAG TPA: CHAT domain-containing protein [Candidatus Dormibacteraeota bacterium]|nr:CHAT domain-containing protein [Candidatus Dormibacteraeota bacterium]